MLRLSYLHYLCFIVFIAFVVLTISSTLGKDLRCPLNLEPQELAPYPYDSTKYYKCLSSGLIQVLTCPTGQTFSLIQRKCTEFDYGHGELEPATPARTTSPSPDRRDCAHGDAEGGPKSNGAGIQTNECECPPTTPCPIEPPTTTTTTSTTPCPCPDTTPCPVVST